MIWINGDLVDAMAASINPRDRGFTLGDGLYETIRVKDGAPLSLDRHFARLNQGLKLLAFQHRADEDFLSAGIATVLSATGLTNAVIRLTVTRGVAARGLAPDPTARPTQVISAGPYTAPTPARLMIATVTRRNEYSPTARVKTTNCLDSILAHIEARRQGVDDALLLNGAGRIAEATAANMFAYIAGVLVTPPIRDGALPGIMRRTVIDIADVEERSLTPQDMTDADEIFLSSSLGIRPVTALDGRLLPTNTIAKQLIDTIELR